MGERHQTYSCTWSGFAQQDLPWAYRLTTKLPDTIKEAEKITQGRVKTMP